MEKRMEVRCCCTPNKLLGTLPVSEKALACGVSFYLVMSEVDAGNWDNLALTDEINIKDIIDFDIAAWQKLVPAIRLAVDEDDEPDISVGYILETGFALKREGITLEILRQIPGFIEEKA